MKNTGNFFALLGTLVLVMVFLVFAIGAYSSIYKANTGTCNYNATGSLNNCTLSDYDYNTLNQSATVSGNTFQLLNYLPYLIGGFVLIAGAAYGIALLH